MSSYLWLLPSHMLHVRCPSLHDLPAAEFSGRVGLAPGGRVLEVSEVQVALHPEAPAEWATAVVATRPIAEGEEILNSYGAPAASGRSLPISVANVLWRVFWM